ncbi:MAG: hypothetical protein K8T89_09125 [Planctomycetes bacterium]|nr:hypothetical protein [Planctomycetota bacterium]
MRMFKVLCLMLAAACLTNVSYAQPGKYTAAVILPEIQMRSGASWQFPATGKLKKGEQVIVHHEDAGWAAIIPPAGTVSWINHRFLGEFDPNGTGKQNALVMADNVEVRVGSDKNTPLGVAQVKLPRGTWVEITGAKLRDDNSTWYPITSPEGEYRWLPKEALGSPAPLAPPPVFVKTETPPDSNKTPATLTSVGPKPAAAANIPQWDKAEQAERSGVYALAARLYMAIYQDLRQKNSDSELILICYNRIIKCQERQRLDGTPSKTNFTATDNSKPSASLQPPGPNNTGNVGVAWPATAAANGGQRWSGEGNLRRAGFVVDGKQAYALEDARGHVIYYVTGAPGVTLDVNVNRRVDLLGTVTVRGDIRGAQYLVASKVNVIR